MKSAPGLTELLLATSFSDWGGTQDTYAELAVLTAWAATPKTWSLAQAASAGLASSTALCALNGLGPIQGETILIEGAAGAVGSAAVAYALDRGARVIGTGRPRNHAFLASIGAEPVAYGPGLMERVASVAPGGVHAAIDTAASGSLAELLELVGRADRLVTVADAAGSASLGVSLVYAENDSALMETAARLGASGSYLPRVGSEIPVAEVGRAHARAESGAGHGKVVVHLTDIRRDTAEPHR